MRGGMRLAWKKANKGLIDLLEKYMKDYQCERKVMFGSPTFFIKGNMFAGVHEDTVILRLSEEDRKEIFGRHKKVTPFTPMGAHVMKEYVTLPESICRNDEIFKYWLAQSYQYSSSLPRKEPKRSGKRKG